ncbi:anthranilate 1,2-dioxygenase small subunit [Paraburkholderia caledonica]|uniref:Anthranilate 1,2-dioxygenase (Deaminating, decarboxylating) small subunit n=1 Tax=Paraburkholderia caledonica TaxID=134536 RepID=A0AB73IKZ4_9BURK|nr:anthranilate 1,2-dioxygenase (deaminating, decarboxylating) small subunit [Paraburkholderia caledonica]
MNTDIQKSVEQFLYRKADLCDRRQWVEYLELFDPKSEFHIPQWESEHVYTSDPKRGMSLIYYATRAGLEDRVFRLGTGKSAASSPMPRTLHQISNVVVRSLDAEHVEAQAKWVTHVYRFGQSSYFYGDSTYSLRLADSSWVIMKKHVVLQNDTIDSVLDFYHV